MVDPEEIRNLALFRSLAHEQQESLAARAEKLAFTAGQRIITQGEQADAFFVILSGQARVQQRDESGRDRPLNYLSAGELFGETGLLSAQPRSASVEGVIDGELLRIDAHTFLGLIADSPSLHARIQTIADARSHFGRHDFPDMAPDEVPLAFERRHRYTIIESLLPAVLMALLIGVLFAVLLYEEVLDPQTVIVAGALVAGVVTAWLLLLIENWRNDHYIVTSKRVIQIDRWYFISDRRSEAAIEQVQTVTTTTPSIIGLLLGYKDLQIRTASDAGMIRFPAVDNAHELSRIILEARDKAVARLAVGKSTEKVDQIQEHLRRHLRGVDSTESAPEFGPGPDEEVFTERNPVTATLDYLLPRFEENRAGVVRWRRHPIVLLRKTIPPLVAFAGAVILTVLVASGAYPFEGVWDYPGVLLGLVFLVALTLGWLFWRYEDWHNDYYELTDSQIIDRNSAPLGINERRNTGGFDAIQDVRVQRPGLLHVLVDMGNVMVDTAAESPAFTFDSVFRPDRIREEIFRRQSAYKERRSANEAAQRRDELADWFEAYDGLRGS